MNFRNLEEGGLFYDAFEGLLDSIPARKKLMLIDACHSGEVDKEELLKIARVNSDAAAVQGAKCDTPLLLNNKRKAGVKNSFELMKEVFAHVGRSTGATVISAAGSTQFALERGDLKNGVFTYSILEFMKQHRQATVTELKQYVDKRVPELTQGVQMPTTRPEATRVEWRVWQAPPAAIFYSFSRNAATGQEKSTLAAWGALANNRPPADRRAVNFHQVLFGWARKQ